MKKIMLLTAMCMCMVVLMMSCSTGKTVDFKKSYEAVISAYGEDYLPNQDIPKETLEQVFGVSMDNVAEFFGQMPMISTQVDTFIAVKAKSGKGKDVADELNKYRDSMLAEGMNYPMNLPKIEASTVVQRGDYVYFILLGGYNDAEEDEAKLLEFYQAETKKGTDALDKVFN